MHTQSVFRDREKQQQQLADEFGEACPFAGT